MSNKNNLSNSKGVPNDKYSEALTMGISAAFAGYINELIIYGLDSYKISRQANPFYNVNKNYFSLFRGSLLLPLLSHFPGCGVFFFLYSLIYSDALEFNKNLDPNIVVISAACIATVPAALIEVPTDVIKKQMFLGGVIRVPSARAGFKDIACGSNNKTAIQTIRGIYSTFGLKGFIVGWQANLLREVPQVAIEMSFYEGLARFYVNNIRSTVAANLNMKPRTSDNLDFIRPSTLLSSIEAALVGFCAGASSALATTPIDNVNTRMKSGELVNMKIWHVPRYIISNNGIKAMYRGLIPKAGISGFGGIVFWYSQARVKEFFQD